MKRKYLIIGWMMAVLAGCQNQDDMADTKPYVQADLAMALTATVPATRMATAEVLETGSRPIQELRIVPFAKQGIIEAADRPRYYEASPPIAYDGKDGGEKRFYYCQEFFFMPGVASFLVYGRAETVKKAGTTDVDKPANGSLLLEVDGNAAVSLPQMVVPASLKFKPDPICESTAIPGEAQCLANYLTAIANVYGQVDNTTVRWSDTSDSWLKAVYLNFINQGNAGTSVLAGSARNVKAYVSRLYQTMANHTFTDGTMEKAIAEAVMDKITDTSAEYKSGSVTMKVSVDTGNSVTSLGTCDSYPNDLDLPDGAAVLLWKKKTETSNYEFVPQTETTTMAGINTISRYAYPAELYYYGNSLIKTNNEEVDASSYGTQTMWSTVLGLYYYDNSVVTTSTKAVAIKEPLQYGVARLSAKVHATSGTLEDANDQEITVGATSFPITGIIVDKQRPVGFDFKPLSNAEEDVKFVYDSRLNTNTGNTNYCLSTTEAADPFLHTLVLQNCEDEDVTVILELQNDSGQDFKGENGVIYKGTKFYLVGKVVKPTYSEGDLDYKKRVFTQDHTTTIGMEISSLAHAYNVLPDILGGRLEIGVEIKTDWEAATPTTVIFE